MSSNVEQAEAPHQAYDVSPDLVQFALPVPGHRLPCMAGQCTAASEF